MCTEVTHTVPISGGAVLGDEWAALDRAVVYYDHPQHTPADHALCIDLWAGKNRVAIELDAASARSLAAAILATLEHDDAPLLAAAP